MRRVIYLLIFSLAACGDSKKESNNNPSGKDSTKVSGETSVTESEFYGQFIYDKTGNVTDSLKIDHPWVFRIEKDKKQLFPNGFVSYQLALTDTLINMCDRLTEFCDVTKHDEKNDSSYCTKKSPAIEFFKPTDGDSYFTTESARNYFFFLSQVDSNFIYANDPHYTLLNFLKLKVKKHGLRFKEKNTEKNYVNDVKIHSIQFPDKLPVYFMEAGKVFEGKAQAWTEAWECGQKYDYAPVYAYLEIPPVKGVRNPDTGEEFDLEKYTMNPCFYFSFLVLDESKNDLKTIKTKSYPMQLVTTAGVIRKGTGLDLNGDKKADVFWYNRIFNPHETVYERQTQLCIKIGREWVPVYSLHYNEFYGYGSQQEN